MLASMVGAATGGAVSRAGAAVGTGAGTGLSMRTCSPGIFFGGARGSPVPLTVQQLSQWLLQAKRARMRSSRLGPQ